MLWRGLLALLLLVRGTSRQIINGSRRVGVELLLMMLMRRKAGVVALALGTANTGGSELDGCRGLVHVVDG